MRIANLLDVTTTELPIWTVEQLTAVCLGPYQRDLAPGYASDYQYRDTVRIQEAEEPTRTPTTCTPPHHRC